MIRSRPPLLCPLVMMVTLSSTAAVHQERMSTNIDQVDALYARREDSASAQQAADILAAAVRRAPADFDAAWRLARVRYWIGNHSLERDRGREFELGAEAARQAIAAGANRPEGHFWLGANLGGLAELRVLTALRYRNIVRQEFEATARLDPGFEAGSAFTALGEWYLRLPGFLGGDDHKAEELLRRALSYDPDSTIARYFLAQTLVATNRKAEARTELQKVLNAPFDPDYTPEDKEWKQKARELLATLGDHRD